MTTENLNNVPFSPPNSNLAVISVVAGLLGLTLFPVLGSIAALITGYMAKNEIQESAGALGGEGLVTFGLVLGWVGVGLTVLGLCLVGALLALGLCFVPLAIFSDTSSWIIPLLAALV